VPPQRESAAARFETMAQLYLRSLSVADPAKQQILRIVAGMRDFRSRN